MLEKIKDIAFNIRFLSISRYLLLLFIFTVPFQVKTLIVSDYLFWSGNFNAYDSFFIFLSDIFLVLAVISWGLSFISKETTSRIDYGDFFLSLLILTFILFTLLHNIIFSHSPGEFFFSVRLIELFALYLMITNEIISLKDLLVTLISSTAVQCAIGIFQFILQGTVGLRFLGEPIIGPEIPGVAKIDFSGDKLIRIYGTFLHPNILSAYITFCLLSIIYLFRQKLTLFISISIYLLVALTLGFSRTAIIAFLTAFLIYFAVVDKKSLIKYFLFQTTIFAFIIYLLDFKAIYLDRILFATDIQSLNERLSYLQISRKMFFEIPWGVGFGQYTNFMQQFNIAKIPPWIMQPVHNIFILIFNELGFLGGILMVTIWCYVFFRLVYSLRKVHSNSDEKPLFQIIISIIGSLFVFACMDHFLITSYQGLVLMFIYLAISSSLLKKRPLPLKNSPAS